MEEWKEYKLGDVCSRLRSGKGIKADSVFNSGKYPVIGGNGVRGYADVPNFEGQAAIIGRQGAYCGNVRFFEGEAYMTEHAIVAVGNELADTRFLACLLSLMHLGNLSAQSAQPGISVQTLSKQPIRLPSISYQKKVSAIIKSLDDKIEVNRRINDNFYYAIFEVLLIWLVTSLRNDNLEQQAQALFRSWFVDFEPFRDQPFVESELGMIPEGWRVGRYEEIIEMTISGDWGKEKREGKYVHKVACIRGCDFQDIKNGLRGNTPERYILEKNYQSKHFHHNDVLVEISGGTQTVSTGRVCPVSQLLIDKFNADIVCTNFCRVIRPIAAYAAYLYYSWLYKYNGKVMFGYENGTSGIKNFRIKDFISVEPVVIPPADLLGKFQQFVDSVQLQIQTRGSESSRLASLRDTLLPRLMSGELKVSETNM